MSASLDSFLNHIMAINTTPMGGAMAGILGASGTGTDTINSLKKTALQFANDYSKPKPNQNELDKLEQEIVGYLQILQLTYTLSEDRAQALMDEIQTLTTEKLEH